MDMKSKCDPSLYTLIHDMTSRLIIYEFLGMSNVMGKTRVGYSSDEHSPLPTKRL